MPIPTDRQKEIVSFLMSRPDWDDEESCIDDITLHETHGAFVLVGMSHALKIKKAVKFDYLDYSTIENRQVYCLRELELNNRTASGLYLDVAGIYALPETGFTFSPTGDAVEWAIRMRSFDAGSQFDYLAQGGNLGRDLLIKITDDIADFHASLPAIRDRDMVLQFRRTIRDNFDQLDNFSPNIFSKVEIETFRTGLLQMLEVHAGLIEKRNEQGYVRFCHGDLHLQNICLLAGKPTLYDGIEFSQDFAITDTFYDFSFLLMDIKARMTTADANQVLNRYFARLGALSNPDEYETLALLPWYLSIRAGIRAHANASLSVEKKVDGFTAKTFKLSAKYYLTQALTYLKPAPARLVAIGGFSGSGKSTLSAVIAPYIGSIPGALHIRSDVIRRKLINWDEYSPMPDSAYTGDMSQKVYRMMNEIAETALMAGHSVVLDAVFDRKTDRSQIATVAKQCNIPFEGLWLQVSDDNLTKRIETRVLDASDATVDVMRSQMARFNGDIEWKILDANAGADEILTQAMNYLKLKNNQL
jgi:uncharacterized protein